MPSRVSLSSSRIRTMRSSAGALPISYSRIDLPFMASSTNHREYRQLVDTIFNARDTITTCLEISYPGFSHDAFDKTRPFTICFLKPTTHTNGNFTRENIKFIIQRLAQAGWFARAARIFRGQALPPAVVINNYPDPFLGKGEYCRVERLAAKNKTNELQAWLKDNIYRSIPIEDLLFIHSYDLLQKDPVSNEPGNPVKDHYGHFPVEFITALWKKGYGEAIYETLKSNGINRLPEGLAAHPKTRIFLITSANISETLSAMDWSKETKQNVEKKLVDLKLKDRFVMCNGFACELLQALHRQDEFIPVILFQRGLGNSAKNLNELRRDVIGDTNPMQALPGSIRGDAFRWYRGRRGIEHPIIVPDIVEVANNIVHCSEDHANAADEFKLWFGKSIFQTLLMGSFYPDEQITDMEENPIIGLGASQLNMEHYLVTNGIGPFSRKFIPIPDTGPDSATLRYKYWVIIRNQYQLDQINIEKHRVNPDDLVTPGPDAITVLNENTIRSSGKSVPVRLLVGAAGQNFRYYDIRTPERDRAKSLEIIDGIGNSPIELRLRELIKRLNQPSLPSFRLQIITNNYNNELVRSRVRDFLKKFKAGPINDLYNLYWGKTKPSDKEKDDIIEAVLDRMIAPSGSLPSMIPQNADLITDQPYRTEQYQKWFRNYAPIHYFSRESPFFKSLAEKVYEQTTQALLGKGLIIPPPEQEGASERRKLSQTYCWTLKALALPKAIFMEKIRGNNRNTKTQKTFYYAWEDVRKQLFTLPPQLAKNRRFKKYLNNDQSFWKQNTFENENPPDPAGSFLALARSRLKTNYGFARYLWRSATDMTKEKGQPGEYCLDRTQILMRKSPGHMDTLTAYIIGGQMREDIKHGTKVAFASCAEDFAFDITQKLIKHVESSSHALTFLVNPAQVGLSSLPKGGFVFSPLDPNTQLPQAPRIYEGFQFPDGKLPEPTKIDGQSVYFHNLFQVGINLTALGIHLFGSRYAAFLDGTLSQAEIKNIVWNNIYGKVDPIIEVRAADQGHIWGAQIVYPLGSITHIAGFPIEFLRRENEDFPYIQIKTPEDHKNAARFYKKNQGRFEFRK